MHLPGANQFFAFVWGSRNVSHTVVDAARLTSSRAIFDLSATQFAPMATALRTAGATAVKISALDLMEPELEVFLEESGIKTLWVEYHPDLFPDAPEVFLDRLGQLSPRCACLPIITDLDLLHVLIQHPGPVSTIALKAILGVTTVGAAVNMVIVAAVISPLFTDIPLILLGEGVAVQFVAVTNVSAIASSAIT